MPNKDYVMLCYDYEADALPHDPPPFFFNGGLFVLETSGALYLVS